MYNINTNLNYTPIFSCTSAIEQPYPLGELPHSIRNAVFEIQQITKAPPSMVANSALGAISLACQNVANVKLPHEKIAPCSLFFMTLAESGERKTSVDSIFMNGIEMHERIAQSQYVNEKEKFEAQNRIWQIQKSALEKKIAKLGTDKNDGLENQLISLIKNKPKFIQTPQLIARDITPEALATSLRSSPSMGLMSNEAGSVLNGRAAEQLPMLNSIWDASPYSVSRKSGDDFVLSGVRLSASLMIQPKTFQKFLEGRGFLARDNGFLARCLFAQPFSTQGSRHQFFINTQRSQAAEHFEKRISEVLLSSSKNTPAERQILEFAPDAQLALVTYSNEIETNLNYNGIYFHIKDAASKSVENAARMAALFHIFEKCEGAISKEHVDGAIQICKWHLNEFRRIFDPLPKPIEFVENAIKIEKWLRKKWFSLSEGGVFPKNKILNFGPYAIRKLSAEKFDMAFDYLCHKGIIELYHDKMQNDKLVIFFNNQGRTLLSRGF